MQILTSKLAPLVGKVSRYAVMGGDAKLFSLRVKIIELPQTILFISVRPEE